jgi:hypothetical protein
MIGCPYCGTMNRKGSRYCSKCGERLDTVPSTRCPSCNAPNLSGNEYCAFCRASLTVQQEAPETDTPPTPPASEPIAETDTAEAEAESPTGKEIPSWLYELATGEEEVVVAPSASAAVPEPDGPLPNRYLHDIGGALPKTAGWLARSLPRHSSASGDSGEPPEGT